jgi:hypothetical protein
MASKVNIEQSIADTIIERPHGFKVGSRSFYLYPVTLGKTYLLGRLVESLEINNEIMSFNPYLEALRLAETKKNESLMIIAYHTAKNKDEVFDYDLILERMDYFEKNLDNEEIAQLLIDPVIIITLHQCRVAASSGAAINILTASTFRIVISHLFHCCFTQSGQL